MPMTQEKIDMMNDIERLRDSGMTFKEISKIYGITATRVKQIYDKKQLNKRYEGIKKAFPGLDWFPAYGLYEEDITSIEELKQLTHEELYDVINRAYPFRDNYDAIERVENYLRRLRCNAAE